MHFCLCVYEVLKCASDVIENVNLLSNQNHGYSDHCPRYVLLCCDMFQHYLFLWK